MSPVLRNFFASTLRKNLPALMLALAGILLSPDLTSCGGGSTSPIPDPPPTSNVTRRHSPQSSQRSPRRSHKS